MIELNRAVELLASRLVVTRQRGQEFDARCPAHGDRSASLTFGVGEKGGAVVRWHAGCTAGDVLKEVGL